ncbi:related to Serine/threonine-protein kinase PRR1 [Zygosaccharomyces bailii ISA1307]|nr:related to Serine/threonine-protein kinase PRR1 [Zygosaccharomyces bailii ISA1307]
MSEEVQGPSTPKIQQQEFKTENTYQNPYMVKETSTAHPNLPSVNTDLPVGSPQSLEQQQTPLSLVISSFDNVQTLPTPMAYTPPVIQPRSPIDQLNIVKRRDPARGRNLNVSPGKQQRYLSELFPLPDSSGQRVSSLPTVNEVSSLDVSLAESNNGRNKLATESGEGTDDGILTGFVVDHYDEPLFWRKVEEIGAGNFSTVYLYESLDQSHPELRQVAVKRIKYPEELTLAKLESDAKYKELLSRLESSLTRELNVLKSLSHPCVVKLYGINNPVFLQSGKPLRDLMGDSNRLPACDMIMSYCAGGDLLSAAASCNGKIEMWLIQRLFAELTLAVKYLHESNVIHRDLKLENIILKYPLPALIGMKESPLYTQKNFIEVADFGLCKRIEPGEMCTARCGFHRDLKLENIILKYPLPALIGMKESPLYTQKNFIEVADFGLCKRIEPGEMCTARCGSEDYVSPEILMGVPYDGRLSDTWALGVILYGLLESRLPFDPPPNATARQRNRAPAHRIARFDWKWFQWAETDTPAKEIVENTLTRKTQRWMVEDIYESRFVKEVASQFAF